MTNNFTTLELIPVYRTLFIVLFCTSEIFSGPEGHEVNTPSVALFEALQLKRNVTHTLVFWTNSDGFDSGTSNTGIIQVIARGNPVIVIEAYGHFKSGEKKHFTFVTYDLSLDVMKPFWVRVSTRKDKWYHLFTDHWRCGWIYIFDEVGHNYWFDNTPTKEKGWVKPQPEYSCPAMREHLWENEKPAAKQALKADYVYEYVTTNTPVEEKRTQKEEVEYIEDYEYYFEYI